jgi:DNA polymerase-4
MTFEQDLTDPADIDSHAVRMAGDLTREVTKDGRLVARVAVKVRTSAFYTRTKIRKLAQPTTDAATVERAASDVLSLFELDRPVRLLGVRVELQPPAASS